MPKFMELLSTYPEHSTDMGSALAHLSSSSQGDSTKEFIYERRDREWDDSDDSEEYKGLEV